MKKRAILLTTLLVMSQAYATDVNSGKPIGQNGSGGQIIVIIQKPDTSGQEGSGADNVKKEKKPGQTEETFNSVREKIQNLQNVSSDLTMELETNLDELMSDETFVNELSVNVGPLSQEEVLMEMALKMSGIELTDAE